MGPRISQEIKQMLDEQPRSITRVNIADRVCTVHAFDQGILYDQEQGTQEYDGICNIHEGVE